MKLLLLLSALVSAAAMESGFEMSDGAQASNSLWITDTSFGGAFTDGAGFEYVGDTRIGGRVRRSDRIIAYGQVRLSVENEFQGAVQMGHFEAYGGSLENTDFVGIRTVGNSERDTFEASACIRFNGGIMLAGPAVSLSPGEHEWHYEWDPTGGAEGHGLLRAIFRRNGLVTGRSELALGAAAATRFFACNAFGLHSGYDSTGAQGSAQVIISEAEYTSLPTPEGIRPGTRVFILLGDENARGNDASIEFLREPRLEKVYVYTDQWTFGQAPSEPRNYFGPEVALGRELATLFQEPVAIIKVTAPGGTLENEWNPQMENKYRQLIETTRLALGSLRAPRLSGVFVMHGESDSCSLAAASRYERNLLRLQANLRADLNAPRLPFVLTRLMSFLQTPFLQNVRAAQSTFPWIDTDDLGQIGDNAHLTGAALMQVGERLAHRYASLVPERSVLRDNGQAVRR